MTATAPKRKLTLWGTLALSLALIGPTLAMSGNGQGLVGSVGWSIPLVLLLGLIVIGFVAYAFVTLTKFMNHAGSAYALVGRTIGPRSGFFSGFALIGTYLGFTIGNVALFGAFTQTFVSELQPGAATPWQISWIVPSVISVVAAAALTFLDTRTIMNVLLALEGLGIVAMLILSITVLGKGGAASTGISLLPFSLPSGTGLSAVIGGIVTAFLTWAGFEACATLGEETEDPKRNIPRTLVGSLLITGVLFIFVMYAQVIGFGTDQAGLDAFQSSGSSLGELANTYIGPWFSLIIVFTAMMSSFACNVAASSTAARLLMAFARDGFGPKWLSHRDTKTDSPRNASLVVIGIALVAAVLAYATSWPNLGTGSSALDAYTFYATAGAICLMVAYLMVEVAAVFFVSKKKFRHITAGENRWLGVTVPTLGSISIVVILYFNLQGQSVVVSPPVVAGAWLLVGLVIAVAARKLTVAIGKHLSEEIQLADGSTAPVADESPVIAEGLAR